MEKVSVIVPVYNGEKSIKRCSDSILNQDFVLTLDPVSHILLTKPSRGRPPGNWCPATCSRV